MKRFILLIAAAVMLAACTTAGQPPTTQQTQVAYVQACAAYSAAFSAAIAARQAGKLTPEQIQQISLIEAQITPICTGPLPADPTAATQQITTAVTTLGVLAATQGGASK